MNTIVHVEAVLRELGKY